MFYGEYQDDKPESSQSVNLLRNRRKTNKRQLIKNEKKLLDNSYKWNKSEFHIGKEL